VKDVMIFRIILQELSFIDEPRNPFAEVCYLANKSYVIICVLNAKVKFSGKLSKFKLDATIFVGFSFDCITRNLKQHVFVRNDS